MCGTANWCISTIHVIYIQVGLEKYSWRMMTLNSKFFSVIFLLYIYCYITCHNSLKKLKYNLKSFRFFHEKVIKRIDLNRVVWKSILCPFRRWFYTFSDKGCFLYHHCPYTQSFKYCRATCGCMSPSSPLNKFRS